ncbi:MAG: biotin--[acetyl-CoA-carboxylase] ligase [Bacteroidia bacterium]|nr:biotin--[acetyl-CoA-carboxylase] ligase [Bacteroidia bacterium]
MNTLFIGQHLITLDETASTNSYLQQYIRENEAVAEGLVVSAKHQTSGRGQRGNTWQATPNMNLLLSILLKPTFIKPTEQFYFNAAIALGVYQYIKSKLPNNDVKIKWPNDILVDGQKIAGILIENQLTGSTISSSVVGIGININELNFEYLLKATSLHAITNTPYALSKELANVFTYVEAQYITLRSNPNKVWEMYHKHLYQKNILCNYMHNSQRMQATIEGVQKGGKLQLRKDSGTIISCHLQEIKYL